MKLTIVYVILQVVAVICWSTTLLKNMTRSWANIGRHTAFRINGRCSPDYDKQQQCLHGATYHIRKSEVHLLRPRYIMIS